MDFLKIMNAFGAIMAWVIIAIVLMAIGPFIIKVLTTVGHF